MLRVATMNEIPAINNLIEQSVRALCKDDYTSEEIESAIKYVFGVDTELVEDKTYYIIENEGAIQACGGWSKCKTLFGGNQFSARELGFLDPKTDAAKIRAFFVSPDHARQGLGTLLLQYCEQQAFVQGFSKTEMMATLSGVKLYQTRGYVALHEKKHLLPNGVSLTFMHMAKNSLELKHLSSPSSHYPQEEQQVSNACPITYLNSNGLFSPTSIPVSRSMRNKQVEPDKLTLSPCE
jgi:N-acetylglutamate synthase-like GNAT family acetyltransferase